MAAAFLESIDDLLSGPHTIIHGEYYPKNILVRDGTVLPADWESAALGAGEIDLATLTEGWGREGAAACVSAYVAARWPGGAPNDFERRLDLARLYMHLCWFEAPRQIEKIFRLAERLGLS